MKNINIVLFNLLVIFILLLLAELVAFSIEFNILIKEGTYKIPDALNYYKRILTDYNTEPYFSHFFRKPVIVNNKNKNIILLGCSFTYGLKLNDNETFQYNLAKETNLNVINLAIPSIGPREILHILRNQYILDSFLDKREIKVTNNKLYEREERKEIYNAEYVIYTFIQDHKRRLVYDLNEHAPHYKNTKENKLILLNNKVYYCSFLYRQLKALQYRYMSEKDIDKLFYTYIKEINNEIKDKFYSSNNKPAKLIILLYNDDDSINWNKISQLKEVEIIKLSEIIHTNINESTYQISENDAHPNAKAWGRIVPALVKELKL